MKSDVLKQIVTTKRMSICSTTKRDALKTMCDQENIYIEYLIFPPNEQPPQID